jgi:hypothetical protein
MTTDHVAEILDLERLRDTPATPSPFPFLIVPNFIRPQARNAIAQAFPVIAHGGSFPLPSLKFGPAFGALVDALTSTRMRDMLAEKLDIVLDGRPVMTTVRGHCAARDGQIHTDSRTKLVTVLLYMNDHADADRGRLRLLRSATDLKDMVAEVPSDPTTLLAFRNDANAWHGFEPIDGPRRTIQVNWVRDARVVLREQSRHRLSAFIKRLSGRGAPHAAAH